MSKEQQIMQPYLDAAKEEVRLKRLFERRKKIDAAISASMARRRAHMDKINQTHWNLSEPVEPLPDREELVAKLS